LAAYRNVAENPWFERLMQELLKGSPPVLGLLAGNPFPDRPPTYARAHFYDYRFADPNTYARTGQWWVRRLEMRRRGEGKVADDGSVLGFSSKFHRCAAQTVHGLPLTYRQCDP